MTVGEKFRMVRAAKRMTLEKMAKALGLKSTGHLSQIERNEKEPSDSLINNLKSTFSLSETWWETGEGPISENGWFSQDTIPVEEQTERQKKSWNNHTRPVAITKHEDLSAAFSVPRPSGKIPIISWAQAGPDGFFEDSHLTGSGFGEINRPYDVSDPNAYALIISGDSMVPKFEPGDVILVSPNMGVRTGDYAVARLKDGTVAAKRVKAKNSHFILESINPDYPPVDCPAEEVVFLHRIVWVKQRG